MADKNIQDIIAVEKELQEKLGAERKKTAEWLSQQKEEIERELQKHIENLESVTCSQQEEVRKAASKKSREIIDQARRRAQHLDGLRDETLLPIVLQHIACIDPRKTS